MSITAMPLVGPFFEGLVEGWTLGEAWMVSMRLLRSDVELVGDPLMRVPLPKAGWNVYGPVDSAGALVGGEPIAMLRDDERSWSIGVDAQPSEGETGVYLVRRVDAQGREETGGGGVAVKRVGGESEGGLVGPIWPAGAEWSARCAGDGWVVEAVWAGRFGALGVERLELVEEVSGESAAVVMSEAVGVMEWRARFDRVGVGDPVRWKVRAVGEGGAVVETAWSGWMEKRDVSVAGLTVV